MKIGLSMLFSVGEPFSSLLERLNKIDVRYAEILDDGLHALNDRRVKALKSVANSRDLEFTVHAPVADINIASPNAVLRRAILRRLEKSVTYSRKLDCRLWVFHPGLKTGISYFYPGLDWRLNIESVRDLLKTARKQGVEISIENVPEPFPFLLKTADDFSRFYVQLDDNLGLTLDVGHANINRQVDDFISKFGSRIVHVHVSDNEGDSDVHRGIGHGTVDWRRVADSLRRIKYNGIVMLESIEHIEESLQALQKLFG